MKQGSLNQLTDETFNQVISEPGIKVVIFTAPSCITCHQHISYLEPHQGDINAPLYEVNGASCPNTIQSLGITKAPAVRVFAPDGDCRAVNADQPTPAMVEQINEVVDGLWEVYTKGGNAQ